MARICGVCKRPPREGEEMHPIRLTEMDFLHTPAMEEGLYLACLECVDEHRQRLAQRLKCSLNEITNNAMC